MDFREATDRLCRGINHASLAKALGVSIPTIRQARLDVQAKARRHPPPNWEHAVIRLAEQQVWNNRKLIEELRARLQEAQKK
jgi:hypothetical protein